MGRHTRERASTLLPVRLLLIDDDGRECLVRDGVAQHKKIVPTALGDRYSRFSVFDLKEPRIRKVYLFPHGFMHR